GARFAAASVTAACPHDCHSNAAVPRQWYVVPVDGEGRPAVAPTSAALRRRWYRHVRAAKSDRPGSDPLRVGVWCSMTAAR
ncbi:MAG: hypothetical protein ACRDSS_14885, partial [Actinocrinis sp.]